MQGRVFEPQTITAIKKKHGNKVFYAMDCIEYPAFVKKSISSVFGNCFVCENKEIAKAICYEFKTFTVTMEGDVYNPSGEVSGGLDLRNRESRILQLADILRLEEEIQKTTQELQQITAQIERMNEDAQAINNVANEIQLKQNQIKQREGDIQSSTYEKFTEEIRGIERQIETNENLLRQNEADHKELQKEIKDIEKQKIQITKTDPKTFIAKELGKLNKSKARLEQELHAHGK